MNFRWPGCLPLKLAEKTNWVFRYILQIAEGHPSSAKPSLVPGGDYRINRRATGSIIKRARRNYPSNNHGKNEPVPLITIERDLAEFLTVIEIGPEMEENQPLQAWKPWLGVSTQVLTRDLSLALGLPRTTRGIRIAQVFPGTPAEQGGLRTGDLLWYRWTDHYG